MYVCMYESRREGLKRLCRRPICTTRLSPFCFFRLFLGSSFSFSEFEVGQQQSWSCLVMVKVRRFYDRGGRTHEGKGKGGKCRSQTKESRLGRNKKE